jgi:phosphatidylglycerophosphate synthase
MLPAFSHIQKTKKQQFTSFSIFLRKISVVMAHYLNKNNITPNQVTIFRVVVFGWVSIYLFYSDSYLYNLAWLGSISLYYVFDLVDGDLARNHDQLTKVWGFLDMNFDAIVLNSVILIFILKFLNTGVDSMYVIAGIMVLYGTIFSSKMTELFQNQFHINCGQWSDPIEKYLQKHKFDTMSTLFYRFITPKWLPFSLLSNFRDYLLLGIIFDKMLIAILCFAIAINMRWITLFIMVAMYYSWIDLDNRKVMMFNILKQNEK